MKTSPEAPDDPEKQSIHEGASLGRSFRESLDLLAVSQVGLFVLVLGYALHEMKPVLLPLVLATMVSLVLQPVYRMFRRIRLPRLLAAVLTMVGLVGVLGFMTWQVANSDESWNRDVTFETMSERVKEVFRPVNEVRGNIQDVADKVEEAARVDSDDDEGKDGEEGEDDEAGGAGGQSDKSRERRADDPLKQGLAADEKSGEDSGKTEKEKPVVVEIRENPMNRVIKEAQEVGLSAVAFLLLVLFTLGYGDRIVRALNKDEGTAELLKRVGGEVTHYLFTITVINAGLGVAIGLAMWGLGMPNPALWGLVAMFLNYVPYLGALAGTCLVFLGAAASFDTPSAVIPIPIAYYLLTVIEGNLITPVILGERFKMNPLVVFVWIFAWGAFWGVAGVLIAMPTLVIFKIACENTATMERFRRVLEA